MIKHYYDPALLACADEEMLKGLCDLGDIDFADVAAARMRRSGGLNDPIALKAREFLKLRAEHEARQAKQKAERGW